MTARPFLLFLLLVPIALLQAQSTGQPGFAPGIRVTPDAHNCYPYDGRWSNRIDRALAGGFPVAIEQDLQWYTPKSGQPRSVVAHQPPLTGNEPGMEQYFFDRVRPAVEAALANPDHSQWPIITLNLDIKTEQPEHLRAILEQLRTHEAWLTTAPKTANDAPAALAFGPILVLNGPSAIQQQVFYDELPIGSRLLTFGAVRTNMTEITAPPAVVEPDSATNYRRWWNNPWSVIEAAGQPKTGLWNEAANERLKQFVAVAHRHGLWIRFYTLDGATPAEQAQNGWSPNYNFPSAAAARIRWQAAIQAGVDYLASDEYELVSQLVHAANRSR
jgi:hypothetical protein